MSLFLLKCSVVTAFGNYDINSVFGAGGEFEVSFGHVFSVWLFFGSVFVGIFLTQTDLLFFFFGQLQSKIQ